MRKTYYSKSAGLQIHAFKGVLATTPDGMKFREGAKPIEFAPLSRGANNAFGWFTTEDPEVQAYLDNRIKETGDIMDGDSFNKIMSLPKGEEDLKRRLLDVENQLAQVLAQQGKIDPANVEKPRAAK